MRDFRQSQSFSRKFTHLNRNQATLCVYPCFCRTNRPSTSILTSLCPYTLSSSHSLPFSVRSACIAAGIATVEVEYECRNRGIVDSTYLTRQCLRFTSGVVDGVVIPLFRGICVDGQMIRMMSFMSRLWMIIRVTRSLNYLCTSKMYPLPLPIIRIFLDKD